MHALIETIYEAAAFPELWPEVLDRVGEQLCAMGAVVAARSSDLWTGLVVSPRIEPGLRNYMSSRRSVESHANIRLLASDRAGWVTDTEFMSEKEWLEDPLFTDWVGPSGGHHVAATVIRIPTGEALIAQVNREIGAPAFNVQDVERLDALRPHLARAGMLATRWRLERMRAAVDALAALGLPAAIVDRGLRTLAANTLIQEMLSYVKWLTNDRIALHDPTANDLLQRGLGSLTGLDSGAIQSCATRSVNGEKPAVVHLNPTRKRTKDLFDGASGLIVITPVAEVEAPNITLIRGLFDLTANEAKVARAITEGLTINEIASRHGVASETIRSQVKAVLAKTGTRRQVEAASLLSGLTKYRTPIK